VADSTQWGTRRIAAIEKFVVSANVGFLAQGHTHPIGHHLPLAVTFEFLKLSGSKWPLYGAEVGTLFGSTRAKS